MAKKSDPFYSPNANQISAATMALPQNPIQNDTDDASRRLLKKNGVKYASDEELESRSDVYEEFEKAFSGLVIFGVFFEFFVAYLHPAYDSPRGVLGPLIGDAFVAIGLAVEVFCGTRIKSIQGELTRRSKDRLTEIIERTAPRSLTKEQVEELAKLKGVVDRVIVTSMIDAEADSFAGQIIAALRIAGIGVAHANPRTGQLWSGIYIVLPERPPDFRSIPLFRAFVHARLPVGCGLRSEISLGDLPVDVPVIMVGSKLVVYPTIPYVAGFATQEFEPPKAKDE